MCYPLLEVTGLGTPDILELVEYSLLWSNNHHSSYSGSWIELQLDYLKRQLPLHWCQRLSLFRVKSLFSQIVKHSCHPSEFYQALYCSASMHMTVVSLKSSDLAVHAFKSPRARLINSPFVVHFRRLHNFLVIHSFPYSIFVQTQPKPSNPLCYSYFLKHQLCTFFTAFHILVFLTVLLQDIEFVSLLFVYNLTVGATLIQCTKNFSDFTMSTIELGELSVNMWLTEQKMHPWSKNGMRQLGKCWGWS